MGQTTWEIADGFWEWCFRMAYCFRVVTYADDTAAKVKRIANLFYRSAWQSFEEFGIDPERHLPYVKNVENAHELYCAATGSVMEFESAGSKGEGRGLGVNRIYFTEYPKYERPDEVLAGIVGSAVTDGTLRIAKDGTGDSVGSVFYREFHEARAGKTADQAFFYGQADVNYPPEFLEKQRLRIRDARRFAQEYPRNIEEAFLASGATRFDVDKVRIAGLEDDGVTPARYLEQIMDVSGRIHLHGVDTAEGLQDSDYSVIATFDLLTNRQTCPTWRQRATPRRTAFAIRDRLENYVGLVVIERNNHGHAVIMKCQDLALRTGPCAGRPVSEFLYVHEHIDAGKKRERSTSEVRKQLRYGWPQTKDSKELLEMETEISLDDETIKVVSENGRKELREYRKDRPERRRGREDDDDDYDDEAIAIMLSQMGRRQAYGLSVGCAVSGVAAVGSMGNYGI